MVEMGLPATEVKVHCRGDGIFWISIMIDENYDNNVITNVTLSLLFLSLSHTHTSWRERAGRDAEGIDQAIHY